ncbi:MAG: sigma-70 family RNA polymerase sigma factor [Bacilli bacterium]|jgi:RNA polymerase sporulation-specific sigma factor
MDLFSENLDLVRRIVNKFNYGYVDKDDLMQAGLMGLHAAVNNYNPNFAVKFNTYATFYILGEIKIELRKQNPIKLSKKIYKIIRYLKKNQDKSFEEIAQILNASRDDVLLAYLYQHKVLSLNRETGKDGEKDTELLNFIPAKSDRYTLITDALASLNDADRELIELRYFQNFSQAEVAKKLGLSQSKISRNEKKALSKLRKILSGK